MVIEANSMDNKMIIFLGSFIVLLILANIPGIGYTTSSEEIQPIGNIVNSATKETYAPNSVRFISAHPNRLLWPFSDVVSFGGVGTPLFLSILESSPLSVLLTLAYWLVVSFIISQGSLFLENRSNRGKKVKFILV